jgi:uncharacterized protein (DUF58 family)
MLHRRSGATFGLIACLVLAGVILQPGSVQAHSRWVGVFASPKSFTEDPGQFQDEVDVEVRLSNYNPFSIRVRCKVEASTTWYPDADNDGLSESVVPKRYTSVKWFRTRIGKAGRFGGRDKTKTVHVAVAHPDKGPESFEFYGDDHFSGWEHGSMDATVNHCHRRR